jgi:predicted kinase
MKKLVIVRGVPGSGKSTYAKAKAAELGAAHVESDMYFSMTGKYIFIPERLPAAHDWCWHQTFRAFKKHDIVVVSNTFTMQWELDRYLEEADNRGYAVHIVQMTKEYGSVHNVPADIMAKMRARFVDNEKLNTWVENITMEKV